MSRRYTVKELLEENAQLKSERRDMSDTITLKEMLSRIDSKVDKQESNLTELYICVGSIKTDVSNIKSAQENIKKEKDRAYRVIISILVAALGTVLVIALIQPNMGPSHQQLVDRIDRIESIKKGVQK